MAFVPSSSLFSKKQCSQISKRGETYESYVWLRLFFANASILTKMPVF